MAQILSVSGYIGSIGDYARPDYDSDDYDTDGLTILSVSGKLASPKILSVSGKLAS